MNWPSVSIAFPCWRRGALLRNTLESIRKQNYPGELELIVVEEENDGLTEQLAAEYGATYIRNERAEPFPVFQSITRLWNMCLSAATNDIVILQCAEVLHKNNVIENLVVRVLGGEKILATPLIEDLAEDGSFAGWYNHPTAGSRPGWVSGAGPHAFRRKEMLEIGGYEELFYGYGHEDDFFFYILRKNGWKIEYVDSALCAHQWHERTKFEPTTGYANRSLIRILTMDIDEGKRQPLANIGSPEWAYVSFLDVDELISKGLMRGLGKTYDDWAQQHWQQGDLHPDTTFVAQRTIANEGHGRISEVGEMITEAAWAVIRSREAKSIADNLASPKVWALRARKCAVIHSTWASRSLHKAYRLMES